MTTVRTRFAPSPTGYMHLGGLRTALFAYLFARKQGGRFILRIEDTDTQREVPGAAEGIYRALALAGLHYDEGPDIGGGYGPYVQTQRKELYLPLAWQLVERGAAYVCFCARERLDALREDYAARGETFKYDKHCLGLDARQVQARIAAGEPYVIRQCIAQEGVTSFEDLLYGTVRVENDTLDDMVLIKADGLPTYNFANVVDDHLMEITHVLRGTEFLSSTPKYSLLYEAFGWDCPRYIHLPVVMKDATRKLSKRYGDPSFEDLLEQGYLPEAVVNFIALLGWSPGTDQEFFSLEQLEQAFDLQGINKAPAILDAAKLLWMNFEYIRRLPPERYHQLALPWYRGLSPKMDLEFLSTLLQPRTEVFSQIPQMTDYLTAMPAFDESLYTHQKMKVTPGIARQALDAAIPALEALARWEQEEIHDALIALAQSMGLKNGQLMYPVRAAITGKASTPGGAVENALLLGREEAMRRLYESRAALG